MVQEMLRGQTSWGALRCLKRRLVNVVYKPLRLAGTKPGPAVVLVGGAA